MGIKMTQHTFNKPFCPLKINPKPLSRLIPITFTLIITLFLIISLSKPVLAEEIKGIKDTSMHWCVECLHYVPEEYLETHQCNINWDKLVQVVIEVESGGRPHIVSKAGAIGLMQITPIVLKEYKENIPENVSIWWGGEFEHKGNVGILYNSIFNVEIGTWYLKRLYHHYKCTTVEEIASAYNGGITRYNKVGRDLKKMPRETRNYVLKVKSLYYKEAK